MQIHINGNIFENKYCHCNEGSLYMAFFLGIYGSQFQIFSEVLP